MKTHFVTFGMVWLAFSCVARANILVNGGFESGDFTGWTLNFVPPNTAAQVFTKTSFPTRVHDGDYFVEFSTNEGPVTGVLSQQFPSVAGSDYRFDFWCGTITYIPGKTTSMLFEALGNDGSTVLASRSNTIAGDGVNAVYQHVTGTFTADGSVASVRFTDQTADSFVCDALLDSVSVTVVPEPTAPALLSVAAIGLLGYWRRRRPAAV
jgi:hypothetical protein